MRIQSIISVPLEKITQFQDKPDEKSFRIACKLS